MQDGVSLQDLASGWQPSTPALPSTNHRYLCLGLLGLSLGLEVGVNTGACRACGGTAPELVGLAQRPGETSTEMLEIRTSGKGGWEGRPTNNWGPRAVGDPYPSTNATEGGVHALTSQVVGMAGGKAVYFRPGSLREGWHLPKGRFPATNNQKTIAFIG